jgi:hypothetical protein
MPLSVFRRHTEGGVMEPLSTALAPCRPGPGVVRWSSSGGAHSMPKALDAAPEVWFDTPQILR